jgi:hypothetical protein
MSAHLTMVPSSQRRALEVVADLVSAWSDPAEAVQLRGILGIIAARVRERACGLGAGDATIAQRARMLMGAEQLDILRAAIQVAELGLFGRGGGQ